MEGDKGLPEWQQDRGRGNKKDDFVSRRVKRTKIVKAQLPVAKYNGNRDEKVLEKTLPFGNN